MPDPTPKKKVVVKVLKKIDPKKNEADKETSSSNRFELTKDYVNAKDKMQSNANTSAGKSYTEKNQGITLSKESLEAKPEPFKRKVITAGGSTGTTRIMSSDGKSVKYEGRSNMQATKDALSKNDSQTKDTNSRRESNSNYYNINSGAKKDLDTKDKETLVRNSKAIFTKK